MENLRELYINKLKDYTVKIHCEHENNIEFN